MNIQRVEVPLPPNGIGTFRKGELLLDHPACLSELSVVRNLDLDSEQNSGRKARGKIIEVWGPQGKQLGIKTLGYKTRVGQLTEQDCYARQEQAKRGRTPSQ